VWNPRAVWTVVLCWSRRRVCRQGSWRWAWHWLSDCSCQCSHRSSPRGRLFADTPDSRAPVTYTPELTQTAYWRKFTSTSRYLEFSPGWFWGFRSSWMWHCVTGWAVTWRFERLLWALKFEALRLYQTPGNSAQQRSLETKKHWIYIYVLRPIYYPWIALCSCHFFKSSGLCMHSKCYKYKRCSLTHNLVVWCVWLTKKTEFISLHSIHLFIFLMEERFVVYEVRTEYLHNIQIRFVLQSVCISHGRPLNVFSS
jgi:hypothetical protein